MSEIPNFRVDDMDIDHGKVMSVRATVIELRDAALTCDPPDFARAIDLSIVTAILAQIAGKMEQEDVDQKGSA